MTQTLHTSDPDAGSHGDHAADRATPAPAEPERPDEPEPSRGHGVTVTLTLNTPDCDPPADGWLDGQLAQLAALAGVTCGQLSVVLVDDAEMSRLHEQYCDLPGTTDVLTFDLRDAPAGGAVEGDLVLCVDEARRQAAQRGHAVRLELLLYAVHGLLHLLGEDDHDPAAYQKMHERENELLTRAGFGPVFGEP